MLKLSLGSSSLITLEIRTQKYSVLESTIQKQLDPLSKFLTIFPTDAPLFQQGCKGERGLVLARLHCLELVVVRQRQMMMMRK